MAEDTHLFTVTVVSPTGAEHHRTEWARNAADAFDRVVRDLPGVDAVSGRAVPVKRAA